jgi:hypothetical protein
MAYHKKFEDYNVVTNALTYVDSSAAVTGLATNCAGFGRATFIFSLGVGLANAKFDAKIWNASSSGATYTSIADTNITQVSTGAGSNINVTISVDVNESYPWLKMSGGMQSSNWPVAGILILSQADTLPPTSLSQENVSI